MSVNRHMSISVRFRYCWILCNHTATTKWRKEGLKI